MRITFYNYRFAPSGLITVITLVFFLLFIALGRWQLQRADYKRGIEQRYQQQLQQPFHPIRLNPQQDAGLNYRKILLKGKFRMDRILLVDNKLYQGQVGYQILIPFFAEGSSRAVLVNRGWVASGYDRQQLPQIRPPLQPTLVKGIVTIPDIRGFHMGQVRLTDQWPQVIPYIDLENIQRGLDFEILPYVIWLSPEVEDYYERDWNPVWSPPEKSEAYAMQWFSFAAIALLLFIVMNLKKIKPEEVDG